MHRKLERYLDKLSKEKEGFRFPNFCSNYSKSIDDKYILAIHQDPGNSGPEETNECSINNPDPSAENLRKVLDNEYIGFNNVLFWNFFPFFDYKNKKENKEILEEDMEFWAGKISELINLLPKVEVLIVSGNDAWNGIRFLRQEEDIQIIHSPHPSRRGINTALRKKRFESAWALAKRKIQGSIITELTEKLGRVILDTFDDEDRQLAEDWTSEDIVDEYFDEMAENVVKVVWENGSWASIKEFKGYFIAVDEAQHYGPFKSIEEAKIVSNLDEAEREGNPITHAYGI